MTPAALASLSRSVPPGGSAGEPGFGEVGPGDFPGLPIVSAPLHPGGTLHSIILGSINDTRDIIGNPARGDYWSVESEFAGTILGGGADFQKITGEYRKYIRIHKKKRRVIAGRLKAGFTTGGLPLFESFIGGGPESLRGYRLDRFWGERLLLANLELREPVGKNLQVVGFIDAGDAWGGRFPTTLPGLSVRAPDRTFKLRKDIGLGLRVVTPIGPLRFDFGIGSEGSQFQFGVGQLF